MTARTVPDVLRPTFGTVESNLRREAAVWSRPGKLVANREGCARLFTEAADTIHALLRAAQLLEAAEDFNANDCRECEGDGDPEACPKCFPLFDDARIARRNAISLATGAS